MRTDVGEMRPGNFYGPEPYTSAAIRKVLLTIGLVNMLLNFAGQAILRGSGN